MNLFSSLKVRILVLLLVAVSVQVFIVSLQMRMRDWNQSGNVASVVAVAGGGAASLATPGHLD